MNNKVVYAHTRNDTGEVFYIGKGTTKRMLAKDCRNKWWNRVVNKHGYSVSTLADGLSDKQSLAIEIFWIATYGRNTLVNGTDGGEGCRGAIRSKAHKQMISLRHKGKKLSQEHINRIKEFTVGSHRNFPNEHREKMSKAQLDKPIVTCPHCNKEGKGSAMIRYHFDNCKQRKV